MTDQNEAPTKCATCGVTLSLPYDRDAFCYGKSGSLIAHQTWRAPEAAISGRALLDMAEARFPNYTHPLSPEKEAAIQGLVAAVQTAVDRMASKGMGGWRETRILLSALAKARAAGLTKE